MDKILGILMDLDLRKNTDLICANTDDGIKLTDAGMRARL